MADYFKPGDVIDMRDTGELVIVTSAGPDGITMRSRADHRLPFGPEQFHPTEWSYTDADGVRWHGLGGA